MGGRPTAALSLSTLSNMSSKALPALRRMNSFMRCGVRSSARTLGKYGASSQNATSIAHVSVSPNVPSKSKSTAMSEAALHRICVSRICTAACSSFMASSRACMARARLSTAAKGRASSTSDLRVSFISSKSSPASFKSASCGDVSSQPTVKMSEVIVSNVGRSLPSYRSDTPPPRTRAVESSMLKNRSSVVRSWSRRKGTSSSGESLPCTRVMVVRPCSHMSTSSCATPHVQISVRCSSVIVSSERSGIARHFSGG
mmetsp:Transcript_4152/g.17055  ORF Transcript_4152/g.17055 Transcript_4152/m.17055 type:complete len:257 (-) Transcript_4152:1129-1899(-)